VTSTTELVEAISNASLPTNFARRGMHTIILASRGSPYILCTNRFEVISTRCGAYGELIFREDVRLLADISGAVIIETWYQQAVVVEAEANVSIEGISFTGTGGMYPGGCVANFGWLSMRSCRFVGCRSEDSNAGALVNNANATMQLESCMIVKCKGPLAGGILNLGGTVHLTECTIANNSNPSYYGGTYYSNLGFAGAIMNLHVMSQNSLYSTDFHERPVAIGVMTLERCTIVDNFAGASYNSPHYAGGIVNRGLLTLKQTLVARNVAPASSTYPHSGGLLNTGYKHREAHDISLTTFSNSVLESNIVVLDGERTSYGYDGGEIQPSNLRNVAVWWGSEYRATCQIVEAACCVGEILDGVTSQRDGSWTWKTNVSQHFDILFPPNCTDALCILSSSPTTPPLIAAKPCEAWCASHTKDWSTKCSWGTMSCAGCDECFPPSPTPMPPGSTSPLPACEGWCDSHTNDWHQGGPDGQLPKCEFWVNGVRVCAACAQCQLLPETPPKSPPPLSISTGCPAATPTSLGATGCQLSAQQATNTDLRCRCAYTWVDGCHQPSNDELTCINMREGLMNAAAKAIAVTPNS